ncbi:COG4315 family predicted lipoprotein [Tranquillimonas alkanivorans]|uniref:Predicted lipoprotein with conserved Yx(FWY)xxD motif n=1 Tax=Tranquillimonas alkanivorans TaxID=441119 RepID=A0A1I5KTW2_9RHOB|nr:hypothetical protein [Tranquillimonas alkanivorans]SFO87861.1 Predicted lipoprotein with conserved Yx(FWY)xxD motif [Tranquillimonas alkanivorans]
MLRIVSTVAAAFTVTAATAQELPELEQDAGSIPIGVIASDEFGPYLTDNVGHPLYVFSADELVDDGIACVGECEEDWPPVVGLSANPVEELDASDFGTVQDRTDMVITYEGWPLYRFVEDQYDETPQGHGVEAYGGTWALARPVAFE